MAAFAMAGAADTATAAAAPALPMAAGQRQAAGSSAPSTGSAHMRLTHSCTVGEMRVNSCVATGSVVCAHNALPRARGIRNFYAACSREQRAVRLPCCHREPKMANLVVF